MDLTELLALVSVLGNAAAAVVPLNDRSSYLTEALDDGRVVDIFPIFFGRVRLGISASMEADGFDDLF